MNLPKMDDSFMRHCKQHGTDHPPGLPWWLSSKESACSEAGTILGLGRSPGWGNGYPLQYSCWDNPKDRGAKWAAVPGVAKESVTTQQLSTQRKTMMLLDFHFKTLPVRKIRGRENAWATSYKTRWLLSAYLPVFNFSQFTCSVMSNSLRPHESQHARPPCPSSTAGVHSDSCPSSQWCHPAISSSVIPFSSCPHSLPASESSPMSQLCMKWPKYWSFSFTISFTIFGRNSKEHPGPISFRMDWLDLLAVQGTLKSLLQHHSSKTSILRCSAFFTVQLSHPHTTTGKTIALTLFLSLSSFLCLITVPP